MKIDQLIEQHRVLGIAVKTLVDAMCRIPASRAEKAAQCPAGGDYDLGYEACLKEMGLRLDEAVGEVNDMLMVKGIELPGKEEAWVEPLKYPKRTGNSGPPDYDTVYTLTVSRWNDLKVGTMVKNRFGQILQVVAKERPNLEEGSITLRYVEGRYSNDPLEEVLKPGDLRLEDPEQLVEVRLVRGVWK